MGGTFRTRKHRRFFVSLLSLFLLLTSSLSGVSHAQTWIGTSGNLNWGTAGNWFGGVPNDLTATATFVGGFGPSTVLLNQNYTVGNIIFNAGQGGITTAFTVDAVTNGNSLHLGSPGITNNTGVTQTLTTNMWLDADATFLNTVAGGLLRLTDNTINPMSYLELRSYRLTVDGVGDTTIESRIGGNGSITKSGTGTLTLKEYSYYTGGTSVTGGTLTLAASSAGGQGPVTVSGGVGGSAAEPGNSSTLNVNATNALNGNSTVTLTGGIGGEIASPGGTAILNANAADGFHSVGTLLVQGGLSGELSAAGNAVVNANVGNALTGIDTITVQGGTGIAEMGVGGIATLNIGAANALRNVPSLTIQGGTGSYNGANHTAVVNANAANALDGVSTITIRGGELGNGMGRGTAILNVSADGALPRNGTIRLEGQGNTSGGTATLNLLANSSALSNQLQLVMRTGTPTNDPLRGGCSVVLNGYNLTLGGIDSDGITSLALQIRNDGTANATLTVGTDNADHAFGGSLTNGSGTGTLALNKVGTGTLRLTGFNNFTGGLTITNGSVLVMSNDTLGTGEIRNNASLIFDVASSASYSSLISGTGSIIKTGGGTLSLVGNNTYSGGTLLQEGVIELNSDTALGTGRLTLAGGRLKSSAATGPRTLGNAVTITAPSILDTGTVTTANPKAPGLTLTGPVMLASDGALTVAGNTRTTITGVIDEDATVRTLVKDGAGTLEITNDNTYTGGTLVRSGTLVVNNAFNRTAQGSGTGEGAVTVARGATLTGTYVISSAVQVNSGGILGIGNSIGQSSVFSLTLAGGSVLDFELGSDGFSSDRLDIATLLTRTGTGGITFNLTGENLSDGTLAPLSEGTFTLLTFGALNRVTVEDFFAAGLPAHWTSEFTLTHSGNGGSLVVTLHQAQGSAAAPEPATVLFLLVAGVGSALFHFHRSRAQEA